MVGEFLGSAYDILIYDAATLQSVVVFTIRRSGLSVSFRPFSGKPCICCLFRLSQLPLRLFAFYSFMAVRHPRLCCLDSRGGRCFT